MYTVFTSPPPRKFALYSYSSAVLVLPRLANLLIELAVAALVRVYVRISSGIAYVDV